jgi:hypothetical protein
MVQLGSYRFFKFQKPRSINEMHRIIISPGGCVDGRDEAQLYLLQSNMLLGFGEEEFPEGLLIQANAVEPMFLLQ